MSHNQGRGGKYPAAIIACQQKHWLQLLRQQPNCGRFEHWNPDQKINEKKTFKEGMWLYILVAKWVWGSQKAFHWKFLQWQVNNWEFWWQALAQCTKTLLWKTNLVDLSDVDVYSVCRQIFLKNENSLKFQYWKNIFPLNTQYTIYCSYLEKLLLPLPTITSSSSRIWRLWSHCHVTAYFIFSRENPGHSVVTQPCLLLHHQHIPRPEKIRL